MTNSYPLIFKQRMVNHYNKKEHKIDDIIIIFGISRGTLYNWVKQYNGNGLSEKKKYVYIKKSFSKI